MECETKRRREQRAEGPITLVGVAFEEPFGFLDYVRLQILQTFTQFTDEAVAQAKLDAAEREQIAQEFQRWAADPTGWFNLLHAEIIARV